ncbi:MAG TPA: hypothetical protein PL055_07785, partial [Methanobacterium sp.]|nr:hypothetical protein [Methanobacterium sp.]
MYNLEYVAPYVVMLVVIGIMVYAKKAIDLLGTAFMVIMGVIIIFAPNAGVNWLFLIIIFLVLGLVFTKYKH